MSTIDPVRLIELIRQLTIGTLRGKLTWEGGGLRNTLRLTNYYIQLDEGYGGIYLYVQEKNTHRAIDYISSYTDAAKPLLVELVQVIHEKDDDRITQTIQGIISEVKGTQ